MAASQIRNPQSDEVVPGQVVIAWRPGKESEVRDLVRTLGGRVIRTSLAGGDYLVAEFPALEPTGFKHEACPKPTSRLLRATLAMTGGVGDTKAQGVCYPSGSSRLGVSDSGLVRLRDLISTCTASTSVRYAEPVLICRACFEPNDPWYAGNQWDKWTMYSDRAWDITEGSKGVKVGIVDEGVDYRHPDLAASFDSSLKGYDFVSGGQDPYPKGAEENHGTHVAGIVGAGLNNRIGVAGWADVTLYSCRVLDDSGLGTTDIVAQGIRWAADHGCRVINLSLGGTTGTQTLKDAVDYAWSLNALVIGAAGNNGDGQLFYPGAYNHALSVGALSVTGDTAYFSNYGPQLGVLGPGENILSTVPNGQYAFMDGTSMASPEISGVAALLLSYRPGLTNSALRAVIEASAVDMGPPGWDVHYGYGYVNAWRALQLADLYATASPRVQASGLKLQATGRLRVYGIQGKLVRTQAASRHSPATLNALPSGVYFVTSNEPPAAGSTAQKVVVVR